MITVIGNSSCSRCIAVKNALDLKGVDYTYTLLSDLPVEEQKRVQREATQAKKTQLPIIYQNNKIIDFQEVSL